MSGAVGIKSCSYTIFASGDADFFDAVAIPLAAAIENEVHAEDFCKNVDEADACLGLRGPTQVRDSFVIIGGVVGVFLFVASRLGGKIVDELYTVKIQPIVKKILGASDSKLNDGNFKSKKVYQFGVWYAEDRVLVNVAVLGDSFAEIVANEEIVSAVHRNALMWFVTNGRGKSVHLYVVEKGRVNATPFLFNTRMEADAYMRNWPVGSDRAIASGKE